MNPIRIFYGDDFSDECNCIKGMNDMMIEQLGVRKYSKKRKIRIKKKFRRKR